MKDLNLPPNPGVDYFFSTINRTLKLAALFGKNLVNYDIHKGGSVNLDFQDENSSTQWHFTIGTDSVNSGRGLLKTPDSTIVMKPATFHALLINQTDYFTARFTGGIRVIGDPNYVVLVNYFVKNFQDSREATGLKGLIRRRFTEKVLKKFNSF